MKDDVQQKVTISLGGNSMNTSKDILMIDPGNAFGVGRRSNPFFLDNFTTIDQYSLENENLDSYKCLVFHGFVDQEYLFTQKEKIRDFLAQKKIVIFSGHLFKEWLPGASLFVPKTIHTHTDYVVSITQDHPIFAGVDADSMTYNKGVSGFFARGHHPIPEGAEVLLNLPGGEPITYIDRNSTEGTILVHSGNDLFGYMRNEKSTDRISGQLLRWVHDEYAQLQEGSVVQ